MNWLDVVLAVIVAASIIASFRQGLTREVIKLASVVVGLLLASWFYGMAGGFLEPYIGSPGVTKLLGFVLVFFGVLLLGTLISFAAGRLLKLSGLSVSDHLLGACFGLARGLFICIALFMAVLAFVPETGSKAPDALVRSRTAPYLASAARVFAALAPHEIHEGFGKTYTRARNAWDKAARAGFQSPKEDLRKNEE